MSSQTSNSWPVGKGTYTRIGGWGGIEIFAALIKLSASRIHLATRYFKLLKCIPENRKCVLGSPESGVPRLSAGTHTHTHTRILPIAQHFKINSTCRGKTNPFDVTLEMRKHKQKRLRSSELPELKPIGLRFSLPVAADSTSQPSRPAAGSPSQSGVWALQPPPRHPSACWEKRALAPRDSLSTFLPSQSLWVLLVFLLSFFFFFPLIFFFFLLNYICNPG